MDFYFYKVFNLILQSAKIIKSENNVIARERSLMCYFFDLIRELMKLALEEVDAGLVEETKKQGYQIEKKNKLVFRPAYFLMRQLFNPWCHYLCSH